MREYFLSVSPPFSAFSIASVLAIGHCRLPPSLMREGSYSTIRLGAYEPLKKMFGATDPAHTPLWKKICSGAISGIVCGL